MIHEKVLKYLRENFPGSIVESEEIPEDFIPIYHEYWAEIAAFLRDDPDLRFDSLQCITGVDLG